MSELPPVPPKRRAANVLGSVPVPDAAGETMDMIPPGRTRRTVNPFGRRSQKLRYPEREHYHRHWFNDDPGRIMEAKDGGYEHVKDEHGKAVSYVVGVSRGGQPLTAYLMEIPLQWYREDIAAQEAVVHELKQQIRTGQFRAGGAMSSEDAMIYGGSATRGNINVSEGGGSPGRR